MILNILHKKLDESTLCPLCQAAMYFIEADQFDHEILLHECSHCEHRVFQDDKMVCHCVSCTQQRKKIMQNTRQQEHLKNKIKDDVIYNLDDLSLLHKLFLLSILDDRVQDHLAHDEFIHWHQIKYQSITPNFLFQSQIVKNLVNAGILASDHQTDEFQSYYLRVRLDGYSEPSLFSITQQLRHWFYENLSMGIPFKSADEVKEILYLVLYQEIIQFTQMYCRTWGIQIAGNRSFQQFCYRLLDHLAVGQIYYLVQTGLEYLYAKQALQKRNENFINTNLLKKTLEQYRERSVNEKWETTTLPRPMNLPFSKMSHIFLFQFLAYDENIFFQPVWRAWKKIEPRLKFYSKKRCMHCGSEDLEIDYDASDYVSLICRDCKHQDHYFTH